MDLSLARAGRYGRAAGRWARLLVAGKARPGVRVFYGHDRVPQPGERAAGGTAKAQKLNERFPNSPTDFSLLYLGTTWLPRDLRPLLRIARGAGARDRRQPGRRRVPGLGGRERGAEPAAARRRARRRPRRLPERVLEAAPRISSSASRGARGRSSTTPSTSTTSRRPERAARSGPVPCSSAATRPRSTASSSRCERSRRSCRAHPDAQLLVTGRLVSEIEPLLDELGLRARVHLLGEYAQREAPAIFRRAHLLLHTKVKDPCPTLVVEAMACGLPVVYPASGGTAELVGDVGRNRRPAPGRRGSATSRRHRRRSPTRSTECSATSPRYSAAARARAVERFSLEPWLDRHARDLRALAPEVAAQPAAEGRGVVAAPGRGRAARGTSRRRRSAGRACARPRAAGSRACAGGSRRSRRRGGRSRVVDPDLVTRRRATGRTRSARRPRPRG